MQPLETYEESQPFQESPVQVIQQQKKSDSSKSISQQSGNSNTKIPQIQINFETFSPEKSRQIKQTTSLQKKNIHQSKLESPLILKKTQSQFGIKTPHKSENNTSVSPTKLLTSSSSISSKKKITIRGFNVHLIDGQQMLSKEECLMIIGTDRISGHLLMTTFRIMFLENGKYLLNIPLGYVLNAQRFVQQKPVTWSKLQIFTKFGTSSKYRFTSQPEASNQLFKLIKKYSSGDFSTLFAFAAARYYKKNPSPFIENTNAQQPWLFDMMKQYERMGITLDQNSLFKKVSNPGGKLCLSYPPQFIITKRVKDQTLSKCFKARVRERIPILSYFHQQKNVNKVSCLWRASQCRTGSTTNRNYADQQYVKCLALQQNKQKSQLFLVYDIRTKAPKQSIFYENSIIKTVTDLSSLLLMRESFTKIASVYESDSTTKWINTIDDSKWYDQIFKILKYAEQIALKMKNGNPILIQCSDGTDRSSQLSTLVQIILCPYYRTIEGFRVLFDKQFIWFGYPFADRLRSLNQERIPTLIQLLDCINQLINMFPLSFEFTSKYISNLANSFYNNKYGNFLCNHFNEFMAKNIKNFSISFWTRNPQQIQINSFFKKQSEQLQNLLPIPSIKICRVWHQYFEGLKGLQNKSDIYKINPHAQQNRDYILLEHNNVKHENLQFELLIQQQNNMIKQLQQEIEQQS